MLLCCIPAFASNKKLQVKTIELKKVSQRINSLKMLIRTSKDKKNTLVKQLKLIETRINKLANSLRVTGQNLSQQEELLSKLQASYKEQQTKLQKQQMLLAQQLRSNYQLGKHEYIKLLLNQRNPNTVSRQLKYFDYINLARVGIITTIDKTLKELIVSKQNIKKNTLELQALVSIQKQQNIELKLQKQQREIVLSALSKQIETKQQKLSELQKNKVNLEKLVNKFKRTQYQAKVSIPFSKLQGKLPWPVRGSIENFYGNHIQDSQLIYNGVLIKAKEGSDVRAIYPGKVVFADWLRGFGLLMIIEHNKGYMTLYAHNHSLLKQVGDQINSGEIIANVGHSGGNAQNGLYFEIRHNGKPINPTLWCNRNIKIKLERG